MNSQSYSATALPVKPLSRHGTLMAVSMMKDEGPYLLEWVAHHLAVGFTDILVYTNDCSDGTDDMLVRLEHLGLAHHRRNVIAKGIKPQPSAIRAAQVEPLVQGADWVMVFDADEFLCLKFGDGTLDPLLDAVTAQGANGLVVTWRIFGSGGVVDWARAPVTEQYLMAAPPDWNKGWGVKTLFRFDHTSWRLGIHRPKLKNRVLETEFPASVKWLNGSGREMEDYFKFRGWRSIQRTVGYDWAQMNHYAIKSIDAYAIRKARGNVNNKADKYNDDYWALQDRNEVRDDTMLRYSARRREIFEGLLSDPELNRLHFAALERAEAKLAAFKASGDYEGFVAGLKAAGQVPIHKVEAKPPKERDPEKIAQLMSEVEKRTVAKRGAEKAKPAGERNLQPPDMLVSGAVDVSADIPVEWHDNHSMTLPADPRLFTALGLSTVAAGKYERNLARNLDNLLKPGGRYAELGATVGFLAGHLAKTRPDANVAVHSDPGWHGALAAIWAKAGIVLDARVTLCQSAALEPCDILALGDPLTTPGDLERLAQGATPDVILLTGRLWCAAFPALAVWQKALARAGFRTRLDFDPQTVGAFRWGVAA